MGQVSSPHYETPLHYFNGKVVLTADTSFLPNGVTDFCINQSLVFPIFFPSLTTDFEWSLIRCLQSSSLLPEQDKGLLKNYQAVSLLLRKTTGQSFSQRIFKWLVHAIILSSKKTRARLLERIFYQASVCHRCLHKTFVRQSWGSQAMIFIKNYKLDDRGRHEALFNCMILAAMLAWHPTDQEASWLVTHECD